MIVVLKMGQNLRALRQTKDLTQEELAEAIGVSPQAISRWENDVALPDVARLPGMADFFDVTLDELVGRDSEDRKRRVWEICGQSQELRGKGDLLGSEILLRDGLRQYPAEESLLSELALTLNLMGGGEHLEEAIKLSRRILAHSTNLKLRSTTAANLCLLYQRTGQKSEALALANTMPHVYESREWNRALAEGSDQALEELLQFTLAALAKRIALREEPGMLLAQGLSYPLPHWRDSINRISQYLSR